MDTMIRADVRHDHLRIAGRKVETGARLEVRYPWDNRLVGTVPRATPELVAEAFQIACDYKPKLTRYQRQKILLKTADLLVSRKEELSRLITLESGLCLKDSLYEVGRAYDVFTFAGQLCLMDDGQTFSCDLTPHGKPRKIFTLRQPLNAISAITPFNHPLNMVAHKLAPAFATNNCVVLKPTELTPLTALFLADTLYEAGLPPQMLSVITGNPSDIGDAMIVDPHADLITFTGSVRVGKYIAEKAGYKRIVLELGGNDPLIVMEDADLDLAVDLAIKGGFSLTGQACTGTSRILVVPSVKQAFTDKLLARVAALKIGNGMQPGLDLGPLATEKQLQTVLKYIAIGKSEARLLCGGERLTGAEFDKGYYVSPAVFTDVKNSMRIAQEEIFGPVLAIIEVADFDDALRQANDSQYGLSASIVTMNPRYMHVFTNEIQAGTVKINRTTTGNLVNAPFGGLKNSSTSTFRESGRAGLEFFTQVKTVYRGV